MKKKRFISLVLSLVMILSLFAAMTATVSAITRDAQVCSDSGILKCDGSGVTDVYLAQTTLRYQMVVILARLL